MGSFTFWVVCYTSETSYKNVVMVEASWVEACADVAVAVVGIVVVVVEGLITICHIKRW